MFWLRSFQAAPLPVATGWCCCSSLHRQPFLSCVTASLWWVLLTCCVVIAKTILHAFLFLVTSSISKKTHSVIQILKKDGALTGELEQELKSCRSADELDHVVRISHTFNSRMIDDIDANLSSHTTMTVSCCSTRPTRKAANWQRLVVPRHLALKLPLRNWWKPLTLWI